MESSSDESFAWTSASSCTSDSSNENMAKSKRNEDSTDKESEYDERYKRKLQKERQSDSDIPQSSNKRRLTFEESDSKINETLRKKIKIEPESDNDEINKSRKKHKKCEKNGDTDAEMYLNRKVKEEQAFLIPETKPKKKNKERLCSSLDLQMKEDSLTEENSNQDESGAGYSTIENEETIENSKTDKELERTESRKKKKKSKKRKSSNDFSGTELSIEDKFSAEETVIETPSDNNFTLCTSVENSKDEISIIEKVNQIHNEISNNSFNIIKNVNKDIEPVIETSTREGSTKRTLRISDRIMFETDSDTDLKESNRTINGAHSSRIKKFLKTNSNLSIDVGRLQPETIIDKDDEIWLVRCPHDLNVSALQDKKLTLDGKCKVKVEGQTYEGHSEVESERIAVLSMKYDCFVINSLPVSGTIKLRKRLPKPHIQDDNMIVNNYTDFIPLPDTKCRHPLFGPNYKNCIKISSSIADKLKGAEIQPVEQSERKKKKKSKKNKHEVIDDESNIEPKSEVSLNIEPEPEIKKKKKRRHADNDNDAGDEIISTKKSKRKKYDLSSAEAWASEKAIEENLFNF